VRLARFERREFLDRRFDWNFGEHAFFCEPTQQGKSYMMYQMAQKVLRDYERSVSLASLMPKPADPATREWMAQLNLAETPRWPPPPRWPWQRKPAGHVVWPPHDPSLPAAENWKRCSKVLSACMRQQYWRGNSLTLGDDSHILAVLMQLNPEIEQHLTAGGGMGSAIWLANQKPSGSQSTGSLTTFAYSAPTHLVFGHDPDERNLKRLAEIGGVNPDEVASIVRDLPVHRISTPQGPKNVSDKLYIHKLGYMCIVGL
jgi:hypothetical protein